MILHAYRRRKFVERQYWDLVIVDVKSTWRTLAHIVYSHLGPRQRFVSDCESSKRLHEASTFPKVSSGPSLIKTSSSVRKFYKDQDELLKNYEEDALVIEQYVAKAKAKQTWRDGSTKNGGQTLPLRRIDDEEEGGIEIPYLANADDALDVADPVERYVRIMSMVSLLVNVLLLTMKMVATYVTGSYSIISSLVDSLVDLTSGGVIYVTERAIRKRDPYLYPRGRTRLEPIALVIISVIMAVASIQVVVPSMEALITGDFEPVLRLLSVFLMVATVAIKFALFLACWRHRTNPNLSVLAQDHRNDCVSNTVAIVCAVVGSTLWKYVDPIGAILVSCYIAVTWFQTGYGQIVMLSGRTAEPSFINRIIKVCIEHDARIECIDTVYVYHFGTKFLVEVHVVMNGAMSVRESHDVTEPLQCKLEALDYVERAFVHIDYEYEHRPEHEHKVV